MKQFLKIYLLIVCSSFHFFAFAQPHIDSIKVGLKNPKSLLNQTENLLLLARLFVDRNLDSAHEYALKAQKIAFKIKNNLLIAESYKYLGQISDLAEIPTDTSAFYFHQALEFYSKASSYDAKASLLLVKTLSAPGSGLESTDSKLSILNEVAELITNTTNYILKADIYDRLAHAWWQKGYDTHEKKYFQMSFDNWKKAQNYYRAANYNDGVATCYHKLASALLEMQMPKEALKYLNAAIYNDSILGNKMMLGRAKMNLGDYYNAKKTINLLSIII